MFVVTGANGRLGRLVARAVAARGATKHTRLLTREPDKVADLAALGFETTRADFADPASLERAFAGAEAVLMISMPGPIDVRIPLHRNCLDAARKAAVGRLVYTSRVNPSEASLYPFAKIHAFSEAHLRSTGLASTIVRNNEYIENLAGAIATAKETGRLYMPGASGKVPYVALRDIADVLALVLTENGHAGQTYELSGPEALSGNEIAARIARIAQRPVEAVPITREEFGALRKEQGRPPFMVEMAMGLYQAIDAGEFARVWPDVPRLLGRPAASIDDFLRKICAE